jgi:PhnB protein
MTQINVYLNSNGTTEEAFRLYQSVFGGEFIDLQRFKDTPGVANLSAADAEKIMHVALPVGDNLVLHCTDSLESMGHTVTIGTNFNLMIEAGSKEEAEKYFHQLSAGGKVNIPLRDEFWGAYFGAVTDRFGIQWMINFDYNQQQ